MKNQFVFYGMALACCAMFSACEKWEDKPAQDLGLTNKYCNIAEAINYNIGFPGVSDSTTCIFPADPFVGSYSFQDSIYTNADTVVTSADFIITAKNRSHFSIYNFCSNANQLSFTADRYYRAASDSLIGAGLQLMCRTEDTLSGSIIFNVKDKSLSVEFKVVSDTGTSIHKGTAYKK